MITRRKSLLLLSGAAVYPAAAAAKDVQDDPTLRLGLPASTSNGHQRWLRLRGFHLVFTNTMNTKLGVWRDWSSWGWFCPSFTITQVGRQFSFKRAERVWTRNAPDPFWIRPGDHYLLPVSLLNKDHWVQPKDFEIDQDQLATVTASFTITPDDETKAVGLWTGTVQVSTDLHLDVASEPRLPF